ncbi:MAG: thioredoxin family protein [Chloroflexota bacterium]
MKGAFYEEAAKDGKLVLLDFGAEWCSTCRAVDNLLEKTMPGLGHRLLWVKVDVHQRSDLAERFNVLSVPTVVLLTPKEEVLWRRSGSFQPRELEAALP